MSKTNFLNDDFEYEKEDDIDEEIDDFVSDEDSDADDFSEEDDVVDDDNNEENDDENNAGDVVVISKSKVVLLKKLLENMKENNEKFFEILSTCIGPNDEARISIGQMSDDNFDHSAKESAKAQDGGRIIEGVFDGENMIGPDGKQYSVPANYASKSKLIEGDILKLTITPSGTFVYKQIGPIERKNIIGVLEQDENSNYYVHFEGNKWRVLTASITYYKGKTGDEVVIIVPKSGNSKWAAVDNIVRNS